MRRPAIPSEDQIMRFGAAGVGLILLASAGLASQLAPAHMLALGTICGANPHPHCGWCLGAAGLALAGLAAFSVASRPLAAAVRRPE